MLAQLQRPRLTCTAIIRSKCFPHNGATIFMKRPGSVRTVAAYQNPGFARISKPFERYTLPEHESVAEHEATQVVNRAASEGRVLTFERHVPFAEAVTVPYNFTVGVQPLEERGVRTFTEPLKRNHLTTSVQGILLAGGESSIPLAHLRALANLPFGSDLHLIDVPIGNFVVSGVNKLFVLAQYNAHTLFNHIAKAYPPIFAGPGNESFVDVLACNQTPDSKHWYRGAAEAVAKNLNELLQPGRSIAEHFIIANGHAVYEMDFLDLLNKHQSSHADVTIVTQCVTKEDARRLGVVAVDEQSELVTNFAEKPDNIILDQLAHGSSETSEALPYLANMGLYVFSRHSLLDLLAFPDTIHFGRDVLPAALSCGMRVAHYHHQGYWKDVVTLRDFYSVSMELTAEHPAIDVMRLYENGRRTTAVLPPAKLQGCDISHALLGSGTVARAATIVDSIVGSNSFIAPGARIERSILLGNTAFQSEAERQGRAAQGLAVQGIGAGSLVLDAVVDCDACVGNNVLIHNQDGVMEADRAADGFVIQDGLVVVLAGAVIPDGTII